MLGRSRRLALQLVNRTMNLVGEGEPLDLSDLDLTKQELAEMRSFLSQARKAIDLVNKGIAMYWQKQYPGESYDDGGARWSVGQRKGKRLVDEQLFYDWLAQQDAGKLRSLISVSSLKVSGLTPGERETFLDETPTSQDVTLSADTR